MKIRQTGASLVEIAIVTAVTALLLGTALPPLQEARQRHRLEGIAAQVETDLQLARSEAVARQEGVRFSLSTDAQGRACYLLHTGAVGAAPCSADGEVLRRVDLPTDAGLALEATSRSMLFDPQLGTVTPTGTLRLRSAAGSLHLVVNVTGRIRGCSPEAPRAGWPRC
jgi:type IV fimbrial biogenesis protein FimT